MVNVALALIMSLTAGLAGAARAGGTDNELQQLIARHVQPLLPANEAGGVAVAIRIDGRTVFFNAGWADLANRKPMTSDALFNLASVSKAFVAVAFAQALLRGELKFDDPVASHVTELQGGGDIGRVTLGQLATHTSGLLLPQDHPPWPEEQYTLPQFIQTLRRWTADAHHEPGRQHMYTHAGFILLHLALERRFAMPLHALIEQRVLKPLGLSATAQPPPGTNVRGELGPALRERAVQGYDENGEPVGVPGDVQGYYLWPGTGQMFSSARDMAVFLAANLGELPIDRSLMQAIELSHRGVFDISPRNAQALAWEVNFNAIPIVEKSGGLNNSSTYIGLMPGRNLGIVILSNRGNQDPTEIGRAIMIELAGRAP